MTDREEALPAGRRLLLHICCAPDATVPTRDLTAEGWQVTGFFYGSNIHPREEYVRRLTTLHRLMAHEGLPLEEGPYAPEDWIAHMERSRLMEEPEGGRRCTECFLMQLASAAEAAVRLGCTHLCTSLTTSPHKDVERIARLGTACAASRGLTWEPRVWRKRNGFLRSLEISRELGLYRQNYCGCVASLQGLPVECAL